MTGTHGRVALVTGSSRGLGAVIARRLARDGFAVAVNSRPGDEQVAAVGAAIRDDGGTAEGFYAYVTDEDQVAGLAEAVADRLGPVDALVFNATGPQPEAAVTDTELGRPPGPAGLLRQESGAARPGRSAWNAGPAVRPHRAD